MDRPSGGDVDEEAGWRVGGEQDRYGVAKHTEKAPYVGDVVWGAGSGGAVECWVLPQPDALLCFDGLTAAYPLAGTLRSGMEGL